MAHDVFKILVPINDRADSSFKIEFSDADTEATYIMVGNGN